MQNVSKIPALPRGRQKSSASPSELRFDLISKDWVVIATGRSKKPEAFKRKKIEEVFSDLECPFCHIETQEKPILVLNKGEKKDPDNFSGKWTTVVIPNKYPAFIPYDDLGEKREGDFYKKMNAVGFHEVVVTRSHKKSFGQMKKEEIKETIDAYKERYLDLKTKKFVNHVSIFHNHGQEAGASIVHPHSQIITTPLVDADLNQTLFNAERFYQESKKCIYCEMNDWEIKDKRRIVFENKRFIVVCPFASKSAFEMIVSPKTHLSYFEDISEEEEWDLSEAFQIAFGKIFKGLGNISYNFYLHTAPCDRKFHPYYHWHWTILPKTSTWAGFEIGTMMEISTIEPEKAAEYLRKQ